MYVCTLKRLKYTRADYCLVFPYKLLGKKLHTYVATSVYHYYRAQCADGRTPSPRVPDPSVGLHFICHFPVTIWRPMDRVGYESSQTLQISSEPQRPHYLNYTENAS